MLLLEPKHMLTMESECLMQHIVTIENNTETTSMIMFSHCVTCC